MAFWLLNVFSYFLNFGESKTILKNNCQIGPMVLLFLSPSSFRVKISNCILKFVFYYKHLFWKCCVFDGGFVSPSRICHPLAISVVSFVQQEKKMCE